MGSADFFVKQTLHNRATVNTKTFAPMFFQCFIVIDTLIKFTQNSDLD